MISESSLKKAFHILNNNNITYSKYISFYQPNYKIILNMWKKYRFLNKIDNSIVKDYFLVELFKFHLNTSTDHGILYYASNSDDAIVFYKIGNEYFTLKLSTIDLGIKNKNIIAIYTDDLS